MFHLTLPTTISVEKIMKYYHPQSHFTLTISPSNLENRRVQHAQTFANRRQEIPTYVEQINGENQPLAAPFSLKIAAMNLSGFFISLLKMCG